MPEAQVVVVDALETLVKKRDADLEVRPESELEGDLGVDSLEIAELSMVLEDELGSDPFSEGLAPRTVQEIIAFYG